MAPGSATWARRTDAGIAVTMLRRHNEAHDVETKPGATDSGVTVHLVDGLARVREAKLLFGPALLKNALEVRTDDAIVALAE